MTINLSKISSEHFCAAPWTNIHVNFSGHVKPCCYGGQTGYSSVHAGSWTYPNPNHAELSKLKQQLTSGVEPEYCKGCEERNWYQEFLEPDLVVDSLDDFNLKSIDVRWGNTCQLSCTYCDQWNSSTWAQLENKAKNRTIPIQGRAYKAQYDDLFTFVSEHTDQIQRVNLLGGEPLLLTENHTLLDLINSDTQVEIFSNLNMNLSKNSIYQKLIQRANVTWRISMETVGERFEFVRRGAQWAQQVQNLQKLSTDVANSNSSLCLQSQFCTYSATRMAELHEFVQTVPGLTVNWSTMMTNPECLNFFLYPDEYKIQCLTGIEGIQSQLSDSDPTKFDLADITTRLKQSLGQTDPNILEKCMKFHQDQESRYFNNQKNFLELWPEYSF